MSPRMWTMLPRVTKRTILRFGRARRRTTKTRSDDPTGIRRRRVARTGSLRGSLEWKSGVTRWQRIHDRVFRSGQKKRRDRSGRRKRAVVGSKPGSARPTARQKPATTRISRESFPVHSRCLPNSTFLQLATNRNRESPSRSARPAAAASARGPSLPAASDPLTPNPGRSPSRSGSNRSRAGDGRRPHPQGGAVPRR